MDDVAERCGILKGSLYYHYASKEAMRNAYLLLELAHRQAWIDALAASGRDPAGALLAVVAGHRAWIDAPDYRGCFIANAAVEFPGDAAVAEVAGRYASTPRGCSRDSCWPPARESSVADGSRAARPAPRRPRARAARRARCGPCRHRRRPQARARERRGAGARRVLRPRAASPRAGSGAGARAPRCPGARRAARCRRSSRQRTTHAHTNQGVPGSAIRLTTSPSASRLLPSARVAAMRTPVTRPRSSRLTSQRPSASGTARPPSSSKPVSISARPRRGV